MSRCDYDGVFYRVFCVTLLATAFTFTVILTNVFIDIDGLLAKKGKQNHETTDNVNYNENIISEATNTPEEVTTDNIFDKNYIDDQAEPSYRTKRSIGSRNIRVVSNYHKNKINILTAQLTKLLENVNTKKEIYSTEINKAEESVDFDLIKPPVEEYFINYDEDRRKKSPEKDLHLAIHRIPEGNVIDNVEDIDIVKTISKLLKSSNNKRHTNIQTKDPEVMMKTIIEITPLDNELKNEISNSQENIKSPRKITYHLHHLKNLERENLSNNEHKTVLKLKILGPHTRYKKNHVKQRVFEIIPKHDQYYYLNKALEYLRQYSRYNKEQFVLSLGKSNKERMKRQVKVRYDEYDATTPKIKPVRKTAKKADDELYVEIETHFDGSGAKGERKKKLVKSLIDRIQKAIRSDEASRTDKKKTHEHLQIKKRIQNPLKHKPKNIMKMSSVEHRQQNPINKMQVKNIPQDADVTSVDDLEEPYTNPNSFSVPNVENSGEAGNSEFNNILSSGIPQRIQVPLNLRHPDIPGKLKNSYADAGNVTLFIKDIDGSGFSVGFNQYVDEPPDVDSMKLFSGLENLIKTYHEDYDQNNNENNNVNEIEESAEKQHELMKREINEDKDQHVVYRRSIEQVENDYRSDAYDIIFDKKMLPYAKYEDVLNRPSKTIPSDYEYKIRNYDYNPKNIKIFTKDIKIKALPIVLNEEIFDKKMRPSEIFSLASLLFRGGTNRQKRSLNVQKITNLKSRIKLARYINTKKMESKSLFYKNNRNKRNVDKIRIFASDQSQGPSRQSEENVYLLSGENFFTNRASLREIELPESDTGDEVAGEQHADDVVPFVFDEPYASNPNKEPNYITNIFDNKYGQNGLMSKYPHIFPSTGRDSKEVQFSNDNEYLFKRDNKHELKLENLLGMRAGENASPEKEGRIPDIVNAIMPNKSNYKVTVKILPKNLTNAPSGFKEMHTVINKTYNNNGVQYYSLVNVSEISKIEKINKTKENESIDENGNTKPVEDLKTQEQEKNMKLLLALQKEKIEQQLLHLNKEKEGLESILRDRDGIKDKNIHDLFKDFLHLQPNKPNDELEFMHDMSHLHVHTATVEPTTESNIILPITNHDIRIKLETPKEPEINKIEPAKDNEHITNEILSQLTKNTDILQCFLKKLSDKFDQSSQTTRPIERVTEENHLRSHPDLKDWGLHHLHDSFFNDHIHKNESHYAIPFVYAYQHPYLPPNKPPLPMAKIVYHGHIHANNLHKYGIDGRKYNPNTSNSKHNHPTTNPSGTREGNKFFIDSLARDVIVTPSKIVQKTDFPAAVVNVTQH